MSLVAGDQGRACQQATEAGEKQLGPVAADVPEDAGSLVPGDAAERLEQSAVDGVHETAVVVLAETVQRAANQQMHIELAAQGPQLGTGAIAQNGFTDAEGAAETGDDAADGGDLDLAGGVADKKDAPTAEFSLDRRPAEVCRNARTLIAERAKVFLLPEAIQA